MSAPVRVVLPLLAVSLCAAVAHGQVGCPPAVPIVCESGQTYRLVYQTVYEQQEVTAYRIEQETVYDEQQVTTYRPVWETQYRECRYKVGRPVTETSYREETYTVSRPVWETQEREECYTVRRPVYETSVRTERYTVMRPVTTCRTQYVDRGCYVEQTVMKPRRPRNKLTWQPAASVVDPVTGQTVYQRPGLYWTQVPRGTYEVQRVWQPNLVAQQVPVTTYVPTVETREVPVQTCRYEEQRVVRKVPYKVCRMVTEQRVRKIPVTTHKMVYEERVKQVPYQVCKMVAEQKTIRVPRCVEKRVPITYTCTVPRVICCRVPLDACGNPIVESPGVVVDSSEVQRQAPTPASPDDTDNGAPERPTLGEGEGDPLPADGNGESPGNGGPASGQGRNPAPGSEVLPNGGDQST
jgi:hypothetical protein